MTEDNFITELFQQDEQKKDLTRLLKDIKAVPLGMSEFQINHFVLNGIEYPTDWSKFRQTKMQLHVGIQSLVDMAFQVQEAQANIELTTAQIDELENGIVSKVNEARIKLKKIDIEKNRFKIASITHTAKEKLREIMAFYAVFRELKGFDSISTEDSKQLEEETWRIRSMYNPEFKNRYGLTPDGFIELPHNLFAAAKSLTKKKLLRKVSSKDGVI